MLGLYLVLHRQSLAPVAFTLYFASRPLDINNARIGAFSPDKRCGRWDGTIGY